MLQSEVFLIFRVFLRYDFNRLFAISTPEMTLHVVDDGQLDRFNDFSQLLIQK